MRRRAGRPVIHSPRRKRHASSSSTANLRELEQIGNRGNVFRRARHERGSTGARAMRVTTRRWAEGNRIPFLRWFIHEHRDNVRAAELTDYEAEQVRRIAAWKAEHPDALSELFKRITLPGVRAVEKVIPDTLVRAAIEGIYQAVQRTTGQEDIKRKAGVHDLAELRHKPLEECDRLATGRP